MLVDSHAHLTSESCFPHVDVLLAAAAQAGVNTIINICTDPESLDRGLELKTRYPQLHNVGATTPHDVAEEGDAYFEYFAQHARKGNLIAVGETGLDYFYEHSPKEIQQQFLRRYLELARACKLPVVIHCREAFKDFFTILDSCYTEQGRHLPGVLHCFTGTVAEAKEVCHRGWYVSFSGIITYKKSDALRDVVKQVPLEKILVETDSPFLAPQSRRGKSNEPAFIRETVEKIAAIKEVPFETVARQTSLNACLLFGL